MQPGIEDILAFEVKKEIADRYFGFRKLIEDDKLALDERVRCQILLLERKLSYSLIRIYILLRDEELIQAFLAAAGLEEKIFFDPYITESPTLRSHVFEGVRRRGLTRAGRFANLLLDSYETLVEAVNEYRAQWGELAEDAALINDTIRHFHHKHDIVNIMSFIRNLNTTECTLGNGVVPEHGMADCLARGMAVEYQKPIEQLLPIIPPLVPAAKIRPALRKLVDRAWKRHGHLFRGEILG